MWVYVYEHNRGNKLIYTIYNSYYDSDADPSLLNNKQVVFLGYAAHHPLLHWNWVVVNNIIVSETKELLKLKTCGTPVFQMREF